MNLKNSYYLQKFSSGKRGGRVNRLCQSCGYKWSGWPKERCPRCGRKWIKKG